MGLMRSTWKRIVKVVTMPDDVMGIARAQASAPGTVAPVVRYATTSGDANAGRSK